MNTTKRYSPECGERAVRLVFEQEEVLHEPPDDLSLVIRETLRESVRSMIRELNTALKDRGAGRSDVIPVQWPSVVTERNQLFLCPLLRRLKRGEVVVEDLAIRLNSDLPDLHESSEFFDPTLSGHNGPKIVLPTSRRIDSEVLRLPLPR